MTAVKCAKLKSIKTGKLLQVMEILKFQSFISRSLNKGICVNEMKTFDLSSRTNHPKVERKLAKISAKESRFFRPSLNGGTISTEHDPGGVRVQSDVFGGGQVDLDRARIVPSPDHATFPVGQGPMVSLAFHLLRVVVAGVILEFVDAGVDGDGRLRGHGIEAGVVDVPLLCPFGRHFPG